jgi:hypothetical protein
MGFFSQHEILKKSHVNMEHLFLMIVAARASTDGNSSRASFSHHSMLRMRQPALRSLKNLKASSVVLMVVVVKGVGALLPKALTGLIT